jgi:hypothetical protein
MAPRNRELEQPKPKADTPVRKWQRQHPAATQPRKTKFGAKDLPPRVITQHRAKPGRTSPQ